MGAAVWSGGALSPTLERRTRAALALWREGGADLLIPSGGLGRHAPSEAAAMRAFLIREGVPDAAIRMEDQATTTFETARHVAAMGVGPGIVAVTDAWHGPRTWLAFRGFGLRARIVTTKGHGPASNPWAGLKAAAREGPGLVLYLVKIAATKR